MEKVILVNKNDEVIWNKEKKDINHKEEFFRVSALWLMNSKWEVLLSQRSFKKAHNPWKWWVAVEWTVSKNESYEECIRREVQEELWITLEKISKSYKYFHEWKYPHFHQFFTAHVDTKIDDFSIDTTEVEKIMWVQKKWITEELNKSPDTYLFTLEQMQILSDNKYS